MELFKKYLVEKLTDYRDERNYTKTMLQAIELSVVLDGINEKELRRRVRSAVVKGLVEEFGVKPEDIAFQDITMDSSWA